MVGRGPAGTWSADGEYCDIIIYDDDPEFWCVYIGQSKFIAHGIAQHLAAYYKQR